MAAHVDNLHMRTERKSTPPRSASSTYSIDSDPLPPTRNVLTACSPSLTPPVQPTRVSPASRLLVRCQQQLTRDVCLSLPSSCLQRPAHDAVRGEYHHQPSPAYDLLTLLISQVLRGLGQQLDAFHAYSSDPMRHAHATHIVEPLDQPLLVASS